MAKPLDYQLINGDTLIEIKDLNENAQYFKLDCLKDMQGIMVKEK